MDPLFNIILLWWCQAITFSLGAPIQSCFSIALPALSWSLITSLVYPSWKSAPFLPHLLHPIQAESIATLAKRRSKKNPTLLIHAASACRVPEKQSTLSSQFMWWKLRFVLQWFPVLMTEVASCSPPLSHLSLLVGYPELYSQHQSPFWWFGPCVASAQIPTLAPYPFCIQQNRLIVFKASLLHLISLFLSYFIDLHSFRCTFFLPITAYSYLLPAAFGNSSQILFFNHPLLSNPPSKPLSSVGFFNTCFHLAQQVLPVVLSVQLPSPEQGEMGVFSGFQMEMFDWSLYATVLLVYLFL